MRILDVRHGRFGLERRENAVAALRLAQVVLNHVLGRDTGTQLGRVARHDLGNIEVREGHARHMLSRVAESRAAIEVHELDDLFHSGRTTHRVAFFLETSPGGFAHLESLLGIREFYLGVLQYFRWVIFTLLLLFLMSAGLELGDGRLLSRYARAGIGELLLKGIRIRHAFDPLARVHFIKHERVIAGVFERLIRNLTVRVGLLERVPENREVRGKLLHRLFIPDAAIKMALPKIAVDRLRDFVLVVVAEADALENLALFFERVRPVSGAAIVLHTGGRGSGETTEMFFFFKNEDPLALIREVDRRRQAG